VAHTATKQSQCTLDTDYVNTARRAALRQIRKQVINKCYHISKLVS